ncbi:MAG: short chain dehydrogenase [Bacteroidales bacterium]|nr:short chain dehydrogenase [Bacteroidales bacterium]
MKIIIIGNGTIGGALSRYFTPTNEVITVGRNSGMLHVDISNSKSIQQLFHETGSVDAIVCAAGEARWSHFSQLSEEDYTHAIQSKLMGQVNLSCIGSKYLNPGGSVTLTTGILADHPVAGTSIAAMVNGAIHSFIKATAPEMPDGIRLNAVSSGLVEPAAEKYGKFFPGHQPIPMSEVLEAYRHCIMDNITGEVIRIYKFLKT